MNNNRKYKELPSLSRLKEILRKTISTAWHINTIHENAINQWLNNFNGSSLYQFKNNHNEAKKLEQRIALFLLCNFVYYNEQEVKHLMRNMMGKYIHSFFVGKNKKTIEEEEIDRLIKVTSFCSLGNQSESSSYMLYLFRQVNDLSKNDFIIKTDCENLVFIDDFSMTGTQAEWYIKDFFKNNPEYKSKNIYILLSISTTEAMDKLKKINGVNNVIACIVMNDTSKAFSDSSIIFQGYSPELKEQAKTMCTYYGEKILSNEDKKDGATPLGYGDCGYLLGTYYNTPNNTLPIIWAEENSWNPIFKRYNKKYVSDNKVRLGGQYV